MCGICGEIGFRDVSVDRGGVDAMLQRLLHRGPDGEWIKGDDQAVFGMARLTIRGLTSGEQPLVDEATGVMVVCNGEIDNHGELRVFLAERGRPVTEDTDVAVLPGLYLELGEAFLGRLVGAFAIAVWDPRSSTLLLARDRAGERPLFYSRNGDSVFFASQLSAIVQGGEHPTEPDKAVLSRYLQLGYFPAPDSPLAGVFKVGPGEVVRVTPNETAQHHYWRLPARHSVPQSHPLEEFDAIFRDAVRRQSEVDVPVGLFLSGGVDSSLIAAVARDLHPDKSITAYGLRFGEESFDEGHVATRVAKDLRMDYVPVWVEPEAIPDVLAEVIATSGEPLADPAWIPTAMLSKRAAEDIRISLSGEGADELFGGYPTYFGAGLAERYAQLPVWLRHFVRDQVERWPPSDKKVTLSFLMKRFVQGDSLDGLSRHILWNSSLSPAILEPLGVHPLLSSWSGVEGESLLDTIQRYDLERSLAEGLLTKADRASMHSALELRAPFLDVSVMEFAGTLNEKQRVRGIKTKVFLKEYARKYLPEEIVYRKKRGLSVPLASWLRGPLKDWAESKVTDPVLEDIGIRSEAVRTLFDSHQARFADHGRPLWALIVVSEWLGWLKRQKGSGALER
jgi:asparagine synthase (glutamine-hydrolysing)